MGSKKVNAYYNGGMTSGDGNSFNSPETMNSRKIIDGFAKNNGLMGMGNGGGMSDVTDVKSYLIQEENNMKKNKQQCVCGNSQNLDGSCDGSHSLNK